MFSLCLFVLGTVPQGKASPITQLADQSSQLVSVKCRVDEAGFPLYLNSVFAFPLKFVPILVIEMMEQYNSDCGVYCCMEQM